MVLLLLVYIVDHLSLLYEDVLELLLNIFHFLVGFQAVCGYQGLTFLKLLRREFELGKARFGALTVGAEYRTVS